MDNSVKGVYVEEIEGQCEYALSAIEHVNDAMQQLDPFDPDRYRSLHSEVFRNLHSFLTHASNVSRMFWPPTPSKKKNEADKAYEDRLLAIEKVVRAKALKEEYSLKENNALEDRNLRNHLEHYDERLDHWSKNSKDRNIATTNIGPLGSISPSPDPLDNMRQYEPDGKIYRFRGEDYDLQSIAAAISEILSLSSNLKEKLRERGTQGT